MNLLAAQSIWIRNAYVEAHFHGVVDLATDIEVVVLDPSFQSSPVEAQAKRLPFPVEWHDGFRAQGEVLAAHPEYRGQHVSGLATQLLDEARTPLLTPAVIGAASRSGRHDEQLLKRVWHLLACFGWAWPT